ncbi:unnamed protein product [Mycena citricolor]|uniref:Uncharacterized protein n=1 Tax=Mycena citricolor TaxID=2018698 RepID=A0AAD2H691_9AGAR|nr:unnamed protein product [Mycena citricolor]
MRDKSDYRLQCKLSGKTGAVLILKARDDGKYLASGALNSNGPKVWDMKDMQQVEVVTVTSDLRGATTKLQWIKREDDIGKALIYGTQNGFIVCCRLESTGQAAPRFQEIWSRQMSAPCEVTGLAFDPATNRLAASHRGGALQVFTLNSAMAENEVFSVVIEQCVPGSLAFGAMSGNERDLLVFGLYCGLVSDVAVDQANGILCLGDPSSGVHLYRLTGRELVKSFSVPIKKTRRIRQVALLDSNRAVASGSNHGVIYVYNRRDNVLTRLQVDPNVWMQTVATADVAGVPTIFAAKSGEVSGKNDIFVYRKTLITPDFMSRLGSAVRRIVWLVVILAAMAFMYEKVMGAIKILRYATTTGVKRLPLTPNLCTYVCHRRMPPSPLYTCERCPLHNFRDHKVWKLERVSHQLEIYHLQTSSGTQTEQVATSESEIVVDDDAPNHVQDDAGASSAETPADPSVVEIERLASLLTGLVILDEGEQSHPEIQSKLFSSRDDFQASIPEVPTEFMPISVHQALGGVEAVLKARSLPLYPAKIETQETNIKLMEEMLQRIRAAYTEVDIQRAFDESSDTVDALASAVRSASLLVTESGRLLSSLKPSDKISPRKRPKVKTRADEKIATLSEKVRAEAASLDSLIDVVGGLLPPPTHEVEHSSGMHFFVIYSSVCLQSYPDHHYENPIAKYDVITQLSILLALICHVIIGISADPVDVIIAFVNAIIQATMALSAHGGQAQPAQEYVLNQLPTSLESALRRFKIDPTTTIYATCPSCHHTHAPLDTRIMAEASYSEVCQGYVYPQRGARHACRTPILECRQGKLRPVKPFVFTSLIDYIAAMLSDPEIERMCDEACDDALAAVREALSKNPEAPVMEDHVNNVFEAAFMRSFKGPIPNKLFVEREGRLRLAFQVMLDFFNPNGTRKCGNHNSIGILALVNLNLPENIRYRPENMWLSIILGPNEPNSDQIGNYIRPLIDMFVVGWDRGIRLSRTVLHPTGRGLDLALVNTVNDLPATRKAQGMAAATSNHYCSICECWGVHSMYDTEYHKWKPRDITVLRAQAFAWRDAPSQVARDVIFSQYGVRWSEFWRLPYWDPTRMAVVDAMHCILEGLVHYHCRRVLRIDTKLAKRKETMGAAFEHDWPDYDAAVCLPICLLRTEARELPMIRVIQQKLVQPLLADEDDTADDPEAMDNNVEMAHVLDPQFIPAISIDELRQQLMRANLQPLRWVVFSLGLNTSTNCIASKQACCDQLLAWRRTKPLTSNTFIPRSINLANIHFIQRVIKDTTTPAWVDSVPLNYGDSHAGTIKAAEWRILATIYLPIALVILWGDQDQSPRMLPILDHTMALFSAVILVCRYTMTPSRASKYRSFLRQWVDGLAANHPHTRAHAMRPNVHMAFHIYDFLILFGPVISWWTFPFERLIGFLQKINTNDHIGGELEATLSKSFMRGASIRRWLRRPDCPPVFFELKLLFDKTFPSYNLPTDSPPLAKDGERAQYKRNSVNFARARTHLGNSLVMYYPPSSRKMIAGSIQKIVQRGEQVVFEIRRQTPLAHGMHDPFASYRPFFPAHTYSSSMSDIIDTVPIDDVISHCARFNFSNNRCVILNLSAS